jgi:hypothetical protein
MRSFAGTFDLDAYRLRPARLGHFYVPSCGRELDDGSVDERRNDGFGEQCPWPYVQPPNAPLDHVEMRSHRPIKCVAGKWYGLSLARHFLSFARSGRRHHNAKSELAVESVTPESILEMLINGVVFHTD